MCDFDTEPYPLTHEEWSELSTFPPVPRLCGVDQTDSFAVEDFRNRAYAAKFHVFELFPPYSGDLFVILRDRADRSPVILTRDAKGQLQLQSPNEPTSL